MSGVKGKSGRKRKSKSRAEAMMSLTHKLPMAMDVIISVSEGTIQDRLRYEAAVEIKNSVIGKPKQQTDLDIKGGEQIGAGLLLVILNAVAEAQKRLQLEGKAFNGQSVTEGESIVLTDVV